MSSDAIKEFDTQKQQLGVCFSQWQGRNNRLVYRNYQQDWQLASWPSGEVLHVALSDSPQIREVQRDGTSYLVAPVVAIVEGVLNQWYVPAKAIEASIQNWNRVPVVINHPVDSNGEPVSAILAEMTGRNIAVGTFENPRWVPKIRGMAGEVWLDVNAAMKTALGKSVVERMRALQPLEVSTGYFVPQLEVASGKFNTKDYIEVHHGLDPDHFALLPTQTGACSWADGCGLPRVASQSIEAIQSEMATNQDLNAYMQECIPHEINDNGYEQQQAIAICYSKHRAGKPPGPSGNTDRSTMSDNVSDEVIQDELRTNQGLKDYMAVCVPYEQKNESDDPKKAMRDCYKKYKSRKGPTEKIYPAAAADSHDISTQPGIDVHPTHGIKPSPEYDSEEMWIGACMLDTTHKAEYPDDAGRRNFCQMQWQNYQSALKEGSMKDNAEGYATVSGEKVPRSKFAYVPDGSKPSTWKLPVHDEAHARNALARFSQADIPADQKTAVARRIVRAAKSFGIDTKNFEKEYLNALKSELMVNASDQYTSSCLVDPDMMAKYPVRPDRIAACQQMWKSQGWMMNSVIEKTLSDVFDGTDVEDVTINASAGSGADNQPCGCEEKTLNKSQTIDALISNKASGFSAADKPMLEKMSEQALGTALKACGSGGAGDPRREERINALIAGGERTDSDRQWLMEMTEYGFTQLEAKDLEKIRANRTDVEERINKAISWGHYKEEDRQFLRGLSREQLGRVLDKSNTQKDSGRKVANVEEYIQQAPGPIRDVLRRMHDHETRQREALLKALRENKKCALRPEELDNMPTETLQRLAQSYAISSDDDFSGVGGFGSSSMYSNESHEDDPNGVPDPPRWMTRKGELPKDLRSKE